MERVAILWTLLVLLLYAKPVRLDQASPQSLVLQQIIDGREDGLATFEEEAFDICRRYVATHEPNRVGVQQAYQGVNSRESLMQEDDDSTGQSAGTLSREIRRPPSRARAMSYKGLNDDSDSSGDYMRTLTSRKRSCIRRGGSCDARPSDCCYRSACRCNLWGTNCRCMRMGFIQRLFSG